MFGGPTYGSGGIGMADVLNEFLSRDPRFVPVNDLKAYQANLIATGFAHPSLPVDGTWNPNWYAADRRQDRDLMDLFRSGAHLGSIPVSRGLEYMAKTVPQGVFEAIVGGAKGFVEQARLLASDPVEAVEEAGLAGGLVTGATVGGLVGGPVGAGIGAAIGGGIGFFTSLFARDEDEEEQQDLRDRLWDALSPYDEYKGPGGAKNFAALFDTVALAAGAIRGVQIGAKGLTAAVRSPSLTRGSLGVTGGVSGGGMVLPTVAPGGRTLAQAGFRDAFRRAVPGSVAPGIVNRMTQAALRRQVLGSAAIGGIIDAAPELLKGEWGDAIQDFGRGAAFGAVTGPALHRVPGARKTIDKAVDFLNTAPLARITESGAGKVVRALYTGFAVPATTARITADLTPGEDPVKRGIQDAEGLTEGTEWDVMDLTVGTLIFPNRMLPVFPREIGDSVRAMNNTHVLMPFLRAEAKRLGVATRFGLRPQRLNEDFVQSVRNKLGAHPDTGEYDELTEWSNVSRMYLDRVVGEEAYVRARAEIPESESTVLGRFKVVQRESEIRAEIIAKMHAEAAADPTAPFSATAKELYERSLDSPLTMEHHIDTWQGRNTSLDNLLDERRAQDKLDAWTSLLTEDAQFRVMPAVRPDPDNGIEGFLTQQEVTQAGKDYQGLTQDFANARRQRDQHRDNELVQQTYTDAAESLDKHLLYMRRRGLIDDSDYISLNPQTAGPDYAIDKKVVKRLDEIAAMRPVENTDMSERLARAGLDRYVAVNTGENMLITADIPKLLAYQGIDQVVRHPVREWFATMATRPDDYRDLGPIRYRSIAAHLDQVAEDTGIGLSGEQIANRFYDYVHKRSDPEWAKKHLDEFVVQGRTGTIIRRTEEGGLGKTRRELLKVEPRDLDNRDIVKALSLDDLPGIDDPYVLADRLKRATHVGAAFGADMHHPLRTARELGRALKLNGLPGFNDYTRTLRVPMHRWADEEGKGFFARATEGSWGYLPAKTRRAHLALQFSLSPAFDASRYMEAISFGAGKGIPPRLVVNPLKFVRDNPEGFVNPLTGERVHGTAAVSAMHQFADHALYGRNIMQELDDLQVRVNNAGILGFKPREVEAAQALWLAQRFAKRGPLKPADLEEIRDAVFTINRYGRGQSAWAKSAHFVFFPYLFQAKQLNLLQDVAFSAPMRTALVHEGMRRWQGIEGEPGLKEDFERTMEKYFPIARGLAPLNNLSYGIGTGRFFLEGLLDSTMANGRVALDKSTYGKITQGLTNFLLPGGIHSTVGESAGGFMDAARHFFVPVVIYEDASSVSAMEEVFKTVERLVPMYRDFQKWFDREEGYFFEQGAALTEGGTRYVQMQDYLDSKRLVDMNFEQRAERLGYSSWASLAQSDAGAGLKEVKRQIMDTLAQEFPRGAEAAQQFVNMDEVKSQALLAIAEKGDRTRAEDAILAIGTIEQRFRTAAEQYGMSQDDALARLLSLVRGFAADYTDDPQFMNLWDQFYRSQWGPLRMVAA